MNTFIKNELKIAKEMLLGLKIPAILFLRFLSIVSVLFSIIFVFDISGHAWWSWLYFAFVFWIAVRINWNEDSSRYGRMILQGNRKK